MMFLDLDRFQMINDTLGHQVGDEMLRESPAACPGLVRETDFVARLGGDEFVIILPAISTPADAATIASKVTAALSTPIEANGPRVAHSPSIGISIFPDDGTDGDTILKMPTRRCTTPRPPAEQLPVLRRRTLNQSAAERLNIERKLRHAIARNELSLDFQPQFSGRDGRSPTGVESPGPLAPPTDGTISPARFIPGRRNRPDRRNRRLGSDHRLRRNGPLDPCRPQALRVAVNVSARQLRRRDFCETVANALTTSGLPPELLELEITSSVMENPQEAIHILERLGRMGVTLAIDDFGTGYSSLAYLKLFPIDHPEDRPSFVADIEARPQRPRHRLWHHRPQPSLGLKVIAEGSKPKTNSNCCAVTAATKSRATCSSKPLNSATAFAFLHARHAAE